MAELMHQGSTVCAKLERRDDISIIDLGEFVTLLGEMSDVIPERFVLLLPTALQIEGIARLHVSALKDAGKDLLEILPTINRVFWQVIE
jgi:hypothetical protein